MKYINYNKWAFHFIIWMLIINIVVFFMIINFNSLTQDAERFAEVMGYFELIAGVLFLATIVFLILSIIKKQEKNYQFWIAAVCCVGYIFQFMISVFSYTIIE